MSLIPSEAMDGEKGSGLHIVAGPLLGIVLAVLAMVVLTLA